MLTDNDVQELVSNLVNADREALPMFLRTVGNMDREDEHSLFLGVLAHSRVCVEIIGEKHLSVN